MCGITAWVSYETDLTQRREILDAMTGTMASRGPDDEGTWVASARRAGRYGRDVRSGPGHDRPRRPRRRAHPHILKARRARAHRQPGTAGHPRARADDRHR